MKDTRQSRHTHKKDIARLFTITEVYQEHCQKFSVLKAVTVTHEMGEPKKNTERQVTYIIHHYHNA
jgi:hypothetical protein